MSISGPAVGHKRSATEKPDKPADKSVDRIDKLSDKMNGKLGVPAIDKSVDKSGDKLADKLAQDKANDKAKNVSHVPCKFFRQAICQAGDKCPFSHEVDTEAQAVCKYFQRGNCKFGSKCALAHITPDGRQMNKKPAKAARKKEKKKDRKEELAKDVKVTPGETPHVIPRAIPKSEKPKTGSMSSQSSEVMVTDPSSVELASQILSKYIVSSPQSEDISSGGVRSFSASLPYHPALGERMQNGDDFAIAYDEDDFMGDDEHEFLEDTSPVRRRKRAHGTDDDEVLEDDEEEEGYTEQLVPSALQDLLTPLERERRNSRNSQQKSGRVFSTPSTMTSPISFGIRRSSSSSEKVNVPMSVPTNADLWGPRHNMTPFSRTAHFGSPPMASAQLSTSSMNTMGTPHGPPMGGMDSSMGKMGQLSPPRGSGSLG